MAFHLSLSTDEFRLLRLVKRKKRLTSKDAGWWVLDGMMRKGALNKVVPRDGRYSGWPYFIISPRGARHLAKIEAKERAARNNGN